MTKSQIHANDWIRWISDNANFWDARATLLLNNRSVFVSLNHWFSLSQTKFSKSVASRRSRQCYKHFGTPSWRANFNFHQRVQPSWVTLPLLHIMVIISFLLCTKLHWNSTVSKSWKLIKKNAKNLSNKTSLFKRIRSQSVIWFFI